VEGLIFPYKDFWGYNHILFGRRSRVYEVRAIKNNINVRSYKDAQGFRIYPSNKAYENGKVGRKINVKKVDTYIYHYSRVRSPESELKRLKDFEKLWHDDEWIKKNYDQMSEWDYSNIDKLKEFPFDAHPELMKPRVKAADWKINPKGKTKFKLKNCVLNIIKQSTGWTIGEYRNFKLLK